MLVRRWTMVGDDVIHSRETPDAPVDAGTSLVLTHGVGTTTRYFRPLLRELEGRIPAAAVDLPGIGPSSARLPDDVAGQADVVAAWMRTTGRHPAVLVGNSMGAQTVVELAVRHPEVTDGVVLIGPTIDAAARGPGRQIVKLFVDATLERPSLIALTLSDSFLTRRRAVYRYFRAALAHRMEDRLPLVSAPVLVIRGERDPLVSRRWARRLALSAREGELVEVVGAAHACHHGRPGVVADLIEGWVRRDPSGSHPNAAPDRQRPNRPV